MVIVWCVVSVCALCVCARSRVLGELDKKVDTHSKTKVVFYYAEGHHTSSHSAFLAVVLRRSTGCSPVKAEGQPLKEVHELRVSMRGGGQRCRSSCRRIKAALSPGVQRRTLLTNCAVASGGWSRDGVTSLASSNQVQPWVEWRA